MHIACPECQTKLNLGQPKPGKYKPKCKNCGKAFVLKVGPGDPPKVAVGKIKPTAGVPLAKNAATAKPKPKASQTRGNVDATMDGSDPCQNSSGKPNAPVTLRSGNSAAASNTESDQQIGQIPDRLGGYKILRMLGRGAMGAVYEAKQVSLDRNVALKTIRGRLADNPSSLARFTREAYAAAQLTHHNVVQIYDFGEDAGKHFFSMEWVRGGPISDLVRDKGSVEPKLAAGYALQAARGLQFAHQNGMVHRDVKPANLLLSNDGIVKVADLGLVKIPDQVDVDSDLGESMSGLQSGTQVTMMGTAVGTPAYMAPEQSIDAASVDHRADIYSLGCTLFFMLTGQPPFDGSVASEVMQQHANESLPNLTDVNARVPAKLNEIVQKAMAKRPSDRYASVAEMTDDLESYLGISKDGSFSPTTDQADQWESIAQGFAKATPLTKLSAPMLLALTSFSVLLTIASPFMGVRWLLLGPSVFIAAVAAVVVMGGSQSAIGNSIRRWISSLSWFDCIVAVFGLIVSLLVCFVVGIWLGLLVGAILGVVAGVAYHMLIVVPSAKSAKETMDDAKRFIRDLRIDGADEDGVRSFAARYAGKSWQRLYESLFGYDSMCTMRDQLRSDPSYQGGPTRQTIRDKVTSRFYEKAQANRQAIDQKRIAKIEEQGLKSQGVSAAEARLQAWDMAQAIIANARSKSDIGIDAAAAAHIKRERQKAMFAEARSGKYAKKRDPFALLKFAFSGQTRLIAGCILLAIFAIWAQGTGLVDKLADGAVSIQTLNEPSDTDLIGKGTSSWSIGVAGTLLCLSAFVSGWKMTPFAVVASIVILFGPPLGIPSIGPLQSWMLAACIGVAIYVPGIIWGEDKEF